MYVADLSVAGHLFQARMWREHVTDWDAPKWSQRYLWVSMILKRSREECLQRARANLSAARAKNVSRLPG